MSWSCLWGREYNFVIRHPLLLDSFVHKHADLFVCFWHSANIPLHHFDASIQTYILGLFIFAIFYYLFNSIIQPSWMNIRSLVKFIWKMMNGWMCLICLPAERQERWCQDSFLIHYSVSNLIKYLTLTLLWETRMVNKILLAFTLWIFISAFLRQSSLERRRILRGKLHKWGSHFE